VPGLDGLDGWIYLFLGYVIAVNAVMLAIYAVLARIKWADSFCMKAFNMSTRDTVREIRGLGVQFSSIFILGVVIIILTTTGWQMSAREFIYSKYWEACKGEGGAFVCMKQGFSAEFYSNLSYNSSLNITDLCRPYCLPSLENTTEPITPVSPRNSSITPK